MIISVRRASFFRYPARFAIAALALALAGCVVGPNFMHPAVPGEAGYVQHPLPSQIGGGTAGGRQTLTLDQDIPAQWWTLFHSPVLNELVEAALKRNPDIDAARAALRQARELSAAQRGFYYPNVSGELNPARQKISSTLASPAASAASYYTLNTSQLTVSFVPDVFGANRRQVESLDAQAESQQFQLEAAKLTLASNVVVAAIQEASLRAQIDATRRLIETQRKVLASFRRQLELGQAAQTDVMAQEAQLAQTEAALPPLEKQLAQQRDLIAALAGRFPAEEIAAKFKLDSLKLPAHLPVSLPSKLVQQRPDIREADAQLHAASAQIGVAIANRLPNIQILGTLGAATYFQNIGQASTNFWSFGAGLTQPIFDAGTLKHRQRAAEAAYEEAAAQYRSTVITAFQNVADALHAIVSDADELRTAQNAENVARHSLDVAQKRLALGDVGSLIVITAEQTWLQALLNRITAQTNRLSDSAGLLQALGGGWWNDVNGEGELGKGKSSPGKSK